MDRNEWSDLKKWYMDLLKSVIIFAVITLAAILFLNKLEDKREFIRNKESALLTLRQQTIPDFVTASVNYETAVYVAYADLYQWKGIVPTDAMRDLETKYYPAYLSSAEIIKASFPKHKNIIKALDQYMMQIEATFRIYDSVRDVRLDKGSSTEIHPGKKRKNFDDSRNKAKELRNKLLPLISEVVYKENIE